MQFILVLLLCIRLVYATVQSSPIEFNNQDWAALKDWLRRVINNYDVTVEDGWINVGHIGSRNPDLDGVDASLQMCLIDTSSRLLISSG